MKIFGLSYRTPFLLVASVFSLLLAQIATASGVLVISAEEFEAVQSWLEEEDEYDRALPVPGAPVITVERPDTSVDVVLPVELSMAFEPEGTAKINLESLVVRYGLFNITKRVRQHLDVSSTGIKGSIHAVKPGSYTFRISISDDRGRTGYAEISFTAVAQVADALSEELDATVAAASQHIN